MYRIYTYRVLCTRINKPLYLLYLLCRLYYANELVQRDVDETVKQLPVGHTKSLNEYSFHVNVKGIGGQKVSKAIFGLQLVPSGLSGCVAVCGLQGR